MAYSANLRVTFNHYVTALSTSSATPAEVIVTYQAAGFDFGGMEYVGSFVVEGTANLAYPDYIQSVSVTFTEMAIPFIADPEYLAAEYSIVWSRGTDTYTQVVSTRQVISSFPGIPSYLTDNSVDNRPPGFQAGKAVVTVSYRARYALPKVTGGVIHFVTNGSGSYVASPIDGTSHVAGELITLILTADPGTTILGYTQTGGRDVGPNLISSLGADITVTVNVESTTPQPYTITGTITYVDKNCPAGHTDVTPVIPGVQAWNGSTWGGIFGPGSTTVSGGSVIEGEITSIVISANDAFRSRIQSFTVDAADLTTDQPTGLPDEQHLGGGGRVSSDYLFFKMPPRNVTFSAVVVSDRFCVPGLTPILPKGIDGRPKDEDGDGIPDPPTGFPPPDWPPPPWEPGGEEPPPADDPAPDDIPTGAGEGGGGGAGGGFPGGSGGSGGGESAPISKVYGGFPNGVDWDRSSEPKGLLIRWRNNNGPWGKWHVVSLGGRGDTKIWRELRAMGQYQTRQYEIVHVDRVPGGVFDIEERLAPTTDTTGGRK